MPPNTPPPAPPPYDPRIVQDPNAVQHDYSFIMNPEKPPKRSLFSGSTSLAAKIGLLTGLLIVLLVVFSVLKGLLSGGSNLDQFITVAQNQQALIHLAENAAKERGLTTENRNFAVTAQASLHSSQGTLIAYLGKNHKKIDAKQLNLGIDSSLDKELAAAVASGTYNKAFSDVAQVKLTKYETTLNQTLGHTKGKKGRDLLKKELNQAQLLEKMLDTPAS